MECKRDGYGNNYQEAIYEAQLTMTTNAMSGPVRYVNYEELKKIITEGGFSTVKHGILIDTADLPFKILVPFETIQSNLSLGFLMESNWENYLNFENASESNIDPIFRMRLAAFARDFGIVLNINSGYRTLAEEKATSNDPNYDPRVSAHVYGFAVDIANLDIRALYSNDATANQTAFAPYGIYKPWTSGNKTSLKEDWHIQPVEAALDSTGKLRSQPMKDLVAIEVK